MRNPIARDWNSHMRAGDAILHDKRSVEKSSEARASLRLILMANNEKNAEALKEVSDLYAHFSKEAFAQQESFNAIAMTVRRAAKEALVECRDLRMALSSEISALIQSLKDLRSIAAGPQHDESIQRLREFIELSERLKALKDSGFLDSIADTILRLDGVR